MITCACVSAFSSSQLRVCQMSLGRLIYTTSTIDPVVLRDSKSAWARGTSCKG